MNMEIVSALINEDYDYLINNYNLLPFQAKELVFFYKRFNSMYHRDLLVKKIENGDFSREDEIYNMAKKYCSKVMSYGDKKSINFLQEKCGYTLEDANRFVSTYMSESKALDDMLSMEVDVSNVNIRMNDMIDCIVQLFLDSQKVRKM